MVHAVEHHLRSDYYLRRRRATDYLTTIAEDNRQSTSALGESVL